VSSTKAPLPSFLTGIGPDRGVCTIGEGIMTPFLTNIGPDRGVCAAGEGKEQRFRPVSAPIEVFAPPAKA